MTYLECGISHYCMWLFIDKKKTATTSWFPQIQPLFKQNNHIEPLRLIYKWALCGHTKVMKNDTEKQINCKFWIDGHTAILKVSTCYAPKTHIIWYIRAFSLVQIK